MGNQMPENVHHHKKWCTEVDFNTPLVFCFPPGEIINTSNYELKFIILKNHLTKLDGQSHPNNLIKLKILTILFILPNFYTIDFYILYVFMTKFP